MILLTDTFLANSSEPWLIPDVDSLPEIDPSFATEPNSGDGFLPYLRDEKLARPWAIPGTPGLEHRIGGLEKQDGTGNISYDPANHELMTHLRAAKVAKIAEDIPPLAVDDPDGDAELLVLGWGSTYGAIQAAARRARARGGSVATAHLVHLNPFPANLGDVLASVREGLRARAQHGPALEAGPRRLPRPRRRRTRRSRGCRSRSASSSRRSRGGL